MLVRRNVLNKTQTKLLSANVTTNTTISDLTFSNLIVGQWYELSGLFSFQLDGGGVNDDAVTVTINNGATVIGQYSPTIGAPDTQTDAVFSGVSMKFQAVATTVTFVSTDASANSFISGGGTRATTFMQLSERNDLNAGTF